MEDLDFTAVLTDMMSATLEAIVMALEAVAETMGKVAEAVGAGMEESAAATDALAMSVDGMASALELSSTELLANSDALKANTEALGANAGAADEAGAAHAEKLGTAMQGAIMPLTIATALTVGVGVAAVHMAGDFQSGLTSLVTGAGESSNNLKTVHDGILDMSVATGESTKQLVDGMYMIESAGYHGKKGLDVLQAAAEGAKVGNADLGTVADATTTIMNDYASSGVGASQAVNELVATVAAGKTHMQDLSGALSGVLPTASAAGIGLNDVMGAMATMTSEGVPAANAATYLRQTMIALEAPSKQTKTALEAVGLSTDEVAAAMHKSLPDALKMITDHVKNKFPEGSAAYVEAIKAIAGGSKQMQGMLDLTGAHMQTFEDDTKNIGDTAAKSGKSIQGWALVQQDFNQQLSQGGASLSVAMIKLGEAIMPVAGAMLKGMLPALKGFGDWLTSHGQQAAIVLGVLAAVLGGALVTALGAVAVAAIGAASAALPFIAIGAGIAGAIAGLILAYNNIKPFHDAVNALGHGMQVLWGVMSAVWQAVAQQLAPVFASLGADVKSNLAPAWASLVAAFNTARPALQVVGAILGGVLVVAIGLLVGGLSGLAAAFGHVVAGAILILTGLAQFISGWIKLIVDFYSGLFTILGDIFTGNWSKLGSDTMKWLHSMWNDIVLIFTGLWTMIRGIWEASVMAIIGYVQGLVAGVVSWFTHMWDVLVGHSIVPDMINAIITWFKSLPQKALDGVAALGTGLISLFDGLAQKALTWGANLIGGLINGIKNMGPSLAKAAEGAAQGIADFLGHKSPTVAGPGHYADQWMPNLGKMLIQGLDGSRPAISQAARRVAHTISDTLAHPAALAGDSASPGALALAAVSSGAGGGYGGGAGAGGTTVTVILRDETSLGGFIAGARLLDPHVMSAFADQLAEEMARRGFLQGRQPISYTGSR